jgi:uncharacterized membrane protein HdeD (DUF308 family)
MVYGASVKARLAALGVVIAVVLLVAAPGASAINVTQAEAAIPLLTADPHHGAGDGVVDADTQGPAETSGGNNVILLVAALGVLIGVLLITRPRRGPR